MSGQALHHVVLAEASRDVVPAAVSLARRLPAGADLVFADRGDPAAPLDAPAHAARPRPYRLLVVGLDLPPATAAGTAERFRRDPAEETWWIDANDWAPPEEAAIRALCGDRWIHVPDTHHPFSAVEAAATRLGLPPDPMGEKLRALVERRLDAGEEARWGRAWRDALDAAEGGPLELQQVVRPLREGFVEEVGVLDRAEGEALRLQVDDWMAHSRVITVPAAGASVALVILPREGSAPRGLLTEAVLEKTGAELALFLYDRAEVAHVEGARHGAARPTDVRPAVERMLSLPWARRDRLRPGSATLRLEGAPPDAMERLVAALA